MTVSFISRTKHIPDKWALNKYHHVIETFIKATQKNEVKDELKTIRACRCTNLPEKKKKKKKKKKSIRRTKIEDIVITNADKGSAVVIVDVKDYITLKILKDK